MHYVSESQQAAVNVRGLVEPDALRLRFLRALAASHVDNGQQTLQLRVEFATGGFVSRRRRRARDAIDPDKQYAVGSRRVTIHLRLRVYQVCSSTTKVPKEVDGVAAMPPFTVGELEPASSVLPLCRLQGCSRVREEVDRRLVIYLHHRNGDVIDVRLVEANPLKEIDRSSRNDPRGGDVSVVV
jgi:hypothetical protein